MKRILLICALSALASSTYAEEVVFLPNIQQGNWNVSGSLTATKNSGTRNDSTQFFVSTAPRYFLIDRLALGLDFSVSTESNSNTVAALGPSAAFYFWNQGHVAAYVSLGFPVGLTDSTVSWIADTRAGLDFFFNPSVALGPAVFYNHYFGRHYPDYSRYGFAAAFSLFL
jgi:hypothetical protein